MGFVEARTRCLRTLTLHTHLEQHRQIFVPFCDDTPPSIGAQRRGETTVRQVTSSLHSSALAPMVLPLARCVLTGKTPVVPHLVFGAQSTPGSNDSKRRIYIVQGNLLANDSSDHLRSPLCLKSGRLTCIRARAFCCSCPIRSQ